MVHGILAGLTWALETVILGIALSMAPMVSTPEAVFLAPFLATFLHDACSSLLLFLGHLLRGKIKELFGTFKTKSFKWLILASAIGGPIGMTGYVLAVNYMGPSVGAVASAVYPAIGTVLAFFFLKERVRWYQWLFLMGAMAGVYGLSYSPGLEMGNFWLGLLGAFMCAFGWGLEAVILAKCFKETGLKNNCVLWVRQTTSALIYGGLLLPILGGWKMMPSLLASPALLGTIASAAVFATVSYLFYYRAIAKVGAAKAMALNITYTAWAILFSFLLLRDFSVLDPLTLCSAGAVVVCGLLAATDFN